MCPLLLFFGVGAPMPTVDPSWWKDPTAVRAAVSDPLYAMRRAKNDPGVGKFTDLGAYYRDVASESGWLDEYAEFMALSKLTGKAALDWTPEDLAAARADESFNALQDAHRIAQWIARRQLREALDEIHDAGLK